MDLIIVAWTRGQGEKIPSSLKRSVKKMMKRAMIEGDVSIVPGCLLVQVTGISRDDVVYLLRMLQNAGYSVGVQV